MRFLFAAVAAVLLFALAGGAGAQSPSVFGTVGPGFRISLSDASSNPVRHLDPGTYTFQIEDKGDIHNFHLTGPGVDKATEIEQVATVMWTVTLTDGSYRFQCDAHPSTLKGNLAVGTATLPTTATPPAKKAPYQLAAGIGPGAKIGVGRLGVPQKVLPAGPVVLVVNDRSTKDNFHLIGPGVNRATSKPGKGTVVWKLTFRRGTYVYRSDATPTLRGSFRVL